MLKKFTYLFSLAFTLVGIAGFLPNGHAIIGVQAHQITAFHNLIHLSTGLSAFYFISQKPSLINTYFTVFAPFYFALGVLGFVFNGNIFNLVIVEPIDNLLHMVIATLCFIVGAVIPRFVRKKGNRQASRSV
jgi:Domain of unknown function (DUF4383)